MIGESENKLILDYAAMVEEVDASPWLRSMRIWRRIAGGLLVITMFLLSKDAIPAAAIATLFTAVATVATLRMMFRGAAIEIGRGYAIRHVILASVLCPFFLIGLFLVPMLVQGDIVRYRLNLERSDDPST